MFNINEYLPEHVLRTSYNDGNFVMGLQSPNFPHGKISQRLISQAFDFERNVLDGLQYIFTASEYLRQSFIKDYGQEEDKVHCIGAGLNFPKEIIDKMLQGIGKVKDYSIPEALLVGADIKRKGGETLLQAFRKVKSAVPKAVLHIVGPRVPLAGYEKEDGIIWHGFLNKDKPEEFAQLQGLYERCTLTVLPSLYEPFGLSPLEGMASGLSSIVSSRWALPESVPAGVVGENVEPGNVEELAEKMTYLFQHPDKLQEYGERCRPWIAEKYRWEKVVDRLEKFFTVHYRVS